MKTKLFTLMFCLLSVYAYGQNLISNGDFENWSTPVSTSYSGVFEATPTDWTFSAGDGNMTKLYQYNQAVSGNFSVILRNTSTTNPSRIMSPLTINSLDAGKAYKLTYSVRGKGTLRNVTLTKDGTTITGATATTPSSSNLFPDGATSAPNEAFDLGTTWEQKECTYTVSSAGQYKLVFFVIGAAGLDGSANNYFLLDNVSLVGYDEPLLSELKVRNNSVINFSSKTTTYNVVLQSNIASPYTITATAANSSHGVEIIQAQNLTGTEAERTATVVVTALDGVTKKTYSIIFSKTTEWIREGFSSDAFYSPFTNEENTWFYDTSASWNNGVFLGDKSIRPRGSGVTEAIFTISNLTNIGTLSFYIKDREYANASPTLFVDYKNPSELDWTSCTNALTTSASYAAYQQLNVPVNRNVATDIRFRVTKTDGYVGYQLDDIAISVYDLQTNTVTLPVAGDQFIGSDGKTVYLTATDKASFQIISISGQVVNAGIFENSKQISSLSSGIYIVRLSSMAGEFVKKLVIY